jgi:hypothetical protein
MSSHNFQKVKRMINIKEIVMPSPNKEYAARTANNPIFLDEWAKNAIGREAKNWNFECRNRGLDDGKDFEDYAGDLYVLWCECCIKHKDSPVENVMTEFLRNSEWKLMDYIEGYFNYIEGSTGRGREPFCPDFYEFTECYRNGLTIDDLAEKYQVSVRTIKSYITENYVTKVPINPLEYLDAHARMRGEDEAYWNLKSKIMPEIDFS